MKFNCVATSNLQEQIYEDARHVDKDINENVRCVDENTICDAQVRTYIGAYTYEQKYINCSTVYTVHTYAT